MKLLSKLKLCAVAGATLVMTCTASAQQPLKISIAVSSSSLPASSARIAQEMGLFEKHGLEAKLMLMDTATVASMALISGSVDFTVTGPSEVILGQARGQKMVVVANLYSGYSPALVVSKTLTEKAGLPLSASLEDKLKALEGATIASTSATSNFTLGLRCAIEMTNTKVRFTYMSQPAMVTALETKIIDGFMASSPYYATPVTKGYGTVWISGPKSEFPSRCSLVSAATLNSTRSFADSHKEEIARVRAVFAELSSAIRERPNDVKAAISKLFSTVDAPTLDLLFQSEAPGFNARPLTAQDLAKELEFVKASGAAVPGLDKLDPATLLLP
jgi:ABC-type nitrate/sulfonate/bicarbonate transport system substrate-binding protein